MLMIARPRPVAAAAAACGGSADREHSAVLAMVMVLCNLLGQNDP